MEQGRFKLHLERREGIVGGLCVCVRPGVRRCTEGEVERYKGKLGDKDAAFLVKKT